jgi:ATP-dependent Lhr-like helicase
VLEGEFRPAGAGTEWCDAEVLRRLRRRSLAALRKEVEPVEPATLGRFLPAWQNVLAPGASGRGALRGVDGVLAVVEQLAGCAVPASALEPLVLGSRVVDYAPAMLDELTATGEVLWAGHATLPGNDGWVSLHLADTAHLTLPDHGELDATPLHDAVLEALAGGGAYFFRQLSDAAGATDDKALEAALWDLVWAGRVGNDTLAPLRALTGSGRTAHRSRRPAPRARMSSRPRRPDLPTRTGPPTMAGRWFLLPELEADPTRRAHA